MTRKTTMELARNRGERGMIQAILHADRVEAHWAETAFSQLAVYAGRKRRPFTMENFREYAEERGLVTPPPDGRAYGGVARRAINRGVVRRVGFAPTKASSGGYMPLYEAVAGSVD